MLDFFALPGCDGEAVMPSETSGPCPRPSSLAAFRHHFVCELWQKAVFSVVYIVGTPRDGPLCSRHHSEEFPLRNLKAGSCLQTEDQKWHESAEFSAFQNALVLVFEPDDIKIWAGDFGLIFSASAVRGLLRRALRGGVQG
jgi:hypothetical protein